MHLNNFSLITRNNIITLAPAYDLLNSSIAVSNAKEELALPLNGKKRNLTRRDFLEYLAKERLELEPKVILTALNTISNTIPHWHALIDHSFLSEPMQKKYHNLLKERCNRISL